MGVERRHESRLWFLIFKEWQRKYENEAVRLMGFSKSGLPFLCLKYFLDILRHLANFDLLNKLKFHTLLNLHQFWRFKNGRPHFENLKIRCFRYKMFKLEYCKNCVDEKMSFNSHVFWDTLYYDRKCLNSSPQGYLWSVVLSFAIFKISN